MPTTIEELEASIQEYTAEANSILSLNRNVLEEYEHRQCEVISNRNFHVYYLHLYLFHSFWFP